MSEHWYRGDGSPCYEVEKKAGGMRPATLADARKMQLVPSVTTVLGIIAKPQLETWKVRQGILAALTLPRATDEQEDAWLARVLDDSRQQAKAAAEEGTRIHDQIERSYRGLSVQEDYRPHVEATRAKLAELFPDVDDWVAEQSFACPQGFGGKTDLHSPSTGIVVDFKGKDGDFTDGKRLAYAQHWQLAAYNKGLGLPLSQCANIFVSRTHPGCVAAHVWAEHDVAEGWEVFEAACWLWRAMKRFDPRW